MNEVNEPRGETSTTGHTAQSRTTGCAEPPPFVPSGPIVIDGPATVCGCCVRWRQRQLGKACVLASDYDAQLEKVRAYYLENIELRAVVAAARKVLGFEWSACSDAHLDAYAPEEWRELRDALRALTPEEPT